jgi:hypothetical protein
MEDCATRWPRRLLATLHVRTGTPSGSVPITGRRIGAPRIPLPFVSSIASICRVELASQSAMEAASHLDVMRVDELIDAERYARGIELLERIVAMLTKLIDP